MDNWISGYNMPEFLDFKEDSKGCFIPTNYKVTKGKYISIKRSGFCKLHRYIYWYFNAITISYVWLKANKNKVVMHTCDNPNCVNPKHLMLGTQIDNINDRKIKGRCASRTNNGNAKLSEMDVKTIREYKSKRTYRQLCEFFGVDRTTISNIVNNKRWTAPLPSPPETKK